MKEAQLKSLFTYHAPHGDQAQRYEKLRAAGLQFATVISELVPESGEKTLAVRRAQEAVMYANAGIACNEPKPAPAPLAAIDPICRCGSCDILLDGSSMRISRTDGSWRCYRCDAVEFPRKPRE